MSEEHKIACPRCRGHISAMSVVALLPDEVIASENARRMGRRQKPHAGPGRPKGARCPGCGRKMKKGAMKEHRADCVGKRLHSMSVRRVKVRIFPSDPSPDPYFVIEDVDEKNFRLRKISNYQYVDIAIRAIADIDEQKREKRAEIRVLGRLNWVAEGRRWRFAASVIGRPRVD
jgi:hypothetical protein